MAVRRLHPDQPPGFAFTAQNLDWAQQMIAKYPPGKQASAVLPLLWRAQEQHEGWLPEPAIRYVADMLGMAYIRVYEVATFYTMFQLAPVGKKAHIQVCGTTPCMLRGAEDLIKICKSKIHHDPHHLSTDGNFSWEEVECLGSCANAPMVQIFKDTYEDLTPELFEKLLEGFAKGNPPKPGSQIGRTASCPEGGPTSLTDPALYDGSGLGTWKKHFAGAVAAAAAAVAPATQPAGAATVTATSATSAPTAAAAQPATGAAGASVETTATAVAASPAQAVATSTGSTASSPTSSGPGAPSTATGTAAALLSGGALASGLSAAAHAGGKTNIAAVAAEGAVAAALKSVGAADVPAAATTAPTAPASSPAAAPTAAAAAPCKPALFDKPRDGKGDDLGLIWGVGDKLHAKLNAMGIWHFDQIAKWTPAEVAWFEAAMEGFKGRIERDKWIEQCKKLADGWRPDHAAGERPKG